MQYFLVSLFPIYIYDYIYIYNSSVMIENYTFIFENLSEGKLDLLPDK